MESRARRRGEDCYIFDNPHQSKIEGNGIDHLLTDSSIHRLSMSSVLLHEVCDYFTIMTVERG